MDKIKKIFILKDSFPEKVKIVSEKFKINEIYDYTDSQTFLNEYKHLLAISKSPEYQEVKIFINPSKCRMIYFDHSCMVGTGGWIDLKNTFDIGFYKLDKDSQKEIFEDLFEMYLNLDNRYIKRALRDISKPEYREYECNFDMVVAGDKLMEFAIADYLYDYVDISMVSISYFIDYFLTDQQLSTEIAKKYNLLNYIICDDKQKPQEYTNHPILSNTIKALLYAIYLCTNSYDVICEIVRNFISLTDNSGKNYDKIRKKYQKLANYLRNKNKYDVQEKISFRKVERIIKEKIDYQFFYYPSILCDYGYRITKVDFKKRQIYLDISYM